MLGNVSLPSFLLGAASGALIAFLCSRGKPADAGEWHIPRHQQSHAIPTKEEILHKFHAEFSTESYEEVKECWKQLCTLYVRGYWLICSIALAKHRRDMVQLGNLLTEDCVYEDCITGKIML